MINVCGGLRKMKSRLNIGVLIDDVNAVFSNQAIKGLNLGPWQ